MNCTVDASVFVAAAHRHETQHADSRAFLVRADAVGARLICPTLILPECAAAISRRTGRERPARLSLGWIQRQLRLELVALDDALASRAMEIAIVQRLRGADSVYVAIASAADAVLITWDGEMLERAAPAATALTPTQWLQQQDTPS